jgi:hypothetical protein
MSLIKKADLKNYYSTRRGGTLLPFRSVSQGSSTEAPTPEIGISPKPTPRVDETTVNKPRK